MKEPSLARQSVPAAEAAPKISEKEARHALMHAVMKDKYLTGLNDVYRWVSWEDTSVPGTPHVVPGIQMKYIERPRFPVLNKDGTFNEIELQRQREEKAKKFMADSGFVFNPDDGTFSVRQLADPAIDGLPIKLREVADRLGFTYKKGVNLDWFPAHIGGTLCIRGDFPATQDLPAAPVEINVLDIANSGRKALPALPEQFKAKKILVSQKQLDATPPDILEDAKAGGAEMVVLP